MHEVFVILFGIYAENERQAIIEFESSNFYSALMHNKYYHFELDVEQIMIRFRLYKIRIVRKMVQLMINLVRNVCG